MTLQILAAALFLLALFALCLLVAGILSFYTLHEGPYTTVNYLRYLLLFFLPSVAGFYNLHNALKMIAEWDIRYFWRYVAGSSFAISSIVLAIITRPLA